MKMNKYVKKGLKVIGILLLLFILLVTVIYFVYNEKMPEGKKGPEADALANKMLDALNKEAYDTTQFLEWSFRKTHYYKWDKLNNEVDMRFDGHHVHLNTKDPAQNKVITNGIDVPEDKPQKIIEEAIFNFNNDSYWLVAPYKVFDPGVERRLVTTEEGEEALLVTYSSGGSTPGDSYLWFFDETGKPKSYKMWVSLIPVGGLEVGWNEWKQVSTGAWLPQSHEFVLGTISMGEVNGYN